jgi:hypothetical protein
MAALSGRDARLRAVVGKGAGMFVLMSRLPAADPPLRPAYEIGAWTERSAKAFHLHPARHFPARSYRRLLLCCDTVAVGTKIAPRPAQIPACAANAPGSMSMCIIGGRS